MAIKPSFTNAQVRKELERQLERIESAIISRLQYIGETFVNNARLNGKYLDQTGNLRSSIGYIVMKNRKVVKENFEKSGKGGPKGVSSAKDYINKLKLNFGNGYVLIVVAGMDYAAAVESRGKDVLTASSIIAKKDLQAAVRNFRKMLK
ncbi:hypothetical protein SAMN03003324_00841 [Pedobacter antarcticus]|uniref:Uncharacterized protein n=1 Tax=Pedobacter antarcticus TaxID=34086 RepID=A0A1I2BEH1_9SPHI|nr:hypothetical protein [Pedobacter antarcticus]SFE54357.1 hypothetical protein SAMN03003324_00841 [Pedobacter antarcticus]